MTSNSPSASGKRSGAPQGLTQRALGGMFWTFSGTGVQAVVQLVVLMALGRLLTPAEFGLMGAAQVVVALSQIVAQLGVGPAVVQRRELEPSHVRVALTLSGLLGFLLGAVVWVGAGPIAAFYRIPELEPVLRGVAILFPLGGLNTVGQSLLSRHLRFRLFVALDVGSYIVGYAFVAVLLAWQGYGVWALVAGNVAQVALRTIAMYVVTRHTLRPMMDWRAGADLLHYGLGHSLGQIGTVISEQGDNLVVGRWLGAAALGVYGRAYNLMVMPASVFGRIVNRVLFPVMAQVQDERHRLGGAYERSLAIVALVSLPLATLLWVVAPEFIPVLLGPQWTGVVLPFRLFSISLLFRMSSKISDACTKASGAVYPRAVMQGVFASMVVLGAFIGQHWGVGGVAVAVSIAMAINWVGMTELSRRVTDLSWSGLARAHAPGSLLAVVIGAAAAGIVELTRSHHLGNLPTLIAASLTAAAVTLMVVKARPEVFLGPHGIWAYHRLEELLRRALAQTGGSRTAGAKGLASVGETNAK
ncbi:MAG TPA: lipopolysaccharide biosynthesis protein [Gemmatimonadales bacterium]